MIQVTIPFPPSVNNLFSNKKSGGRFSSPTYKAWKEAAGWSIKSGRPYKITGHFTATLVADRKDRRRRDLDNALKACLDLLVALDLIEDDSLAEHVEIGWKTPFHSPEYVKDAQVYITIKPLEA